VLLSQDKLLLKDIMAPATYGIYSNIVPCTTAEDPATVPAANPACIPAKRAMQSTIKKPVRFLLTGPPSPLLLEAPTGAARAEAVTTAVVVFVAKHLTTRTARVTAYPGPLLLTGPALVLPLTGPAAVLLLEAPPAVLMLPAPPTASPPAIATTAVVVFIAKDLSKRPQTTNTTARLLLLTGPAPQLLLTAPPAQLLLEGPPARLLLEGPQASPPPAITTAVVIFIAKYLTKRGKAPSAAVRPLRLTWLAPPPVLLLAAPPTRMLQQASLAALPPATNLQLANVAVPVTLVENCTKQPARSTPNLLLPSVPAPRLLHPAPSLVSRPVRPYSQPLLCDPNPWLCSPPCCASILLNTPQAASITWV